MKSIVYALILVLTTSFINIDAQFNSKNKKWSLGAGLRLGIGSMMQKSEDSSNDNTKGFDGAAEGVFIYYFTKKYDAPLFGVRTGLSLGYRQNSIMMDDIDLTYQSKDALGNSITYHATAKDVKETDRLFSVEIPVMCAMKYYRYYANLGVRMGIPLLSRYKQTMKDPSLTATYDDFEVTLRDEKVSGVVSNDDQKQKAKLDAASFSLNASLEGGYTFTVLGRDLRVGIYMDYGIVDNFKGKGNNFTDADPSTIDGATSTPTSVVVHSLTDSYVNKVGLFCGGVRAVYILKGKGAGSGYRRR